MKNNNINIYIVCIYKAYSLYMQAKLKCSNPQFN